MGLQERLYPDTLLPAEAARPNGLLDLLYVGLEDLLPRGEAPPEAREGDIPIPVRRGLGEDRQDEGAQDIPAVRRFILGPRWIPINP